MKGECSDQTVEPCLLSQSAPEQAHKRTADAVFSLVALKLAPFHHVNQERTGALTIDRWQQEGATGAIIDLTCDASTGVSFVSVLVDDAATATNVAQKLNTFLMLRPASEFVDLALHLPTDPSALLRAAIASSEDEDPRLAGAVRDGLRSTSEALRGAAIKAAALLTWRSLAGDLQAASTRETVPELKGFLNIALRKCTP